MYQKKIEFRPAAENDIPEIISMMAQFYAIDKYPFDEVRTRENLHLLISRPELGRIWLVDSPESTLGYLVLTFGFSFEYGGRDAFIDELFLVPEARHKGIGKSAMEFVQHEAQLFGIKVLHLEAEQHNAAALDLYKAHGFSHNGRFLLSKNLKK